jgi:formyltetrahydrofolate hydrolase
MKSSRIGIQIMHCMKNKSLPYLKKIKEQIKILGNCKISLCVLLQHLNIFSEMKIKEFFLVLNVVHSLLGGVMIVW